MHLVLDTVLCCHHKFRLGLLDKWSAGKVDSADPECLPKCY